MGGVRLFRNPPGLKSTGQEDWPSCLVFLHHLRHKAAHGFRRLILHLPGGVSVGAQGEARVVVAQHTGDRLDVHAVLEGQRSESVPLWHNKDKSENPCIARRKGDRELLPQRAA